MAGTVDCLIFSKDRPAQLELLLRSIGRFAPDLYRTVTVLFTSSEPCFRDGYLQVISEHPDPRYLSETGFEEQTRGWLGQAGPLVSFLVDDDVFYAACPAVTPPPFSLRGGDYDYPFSLDGAVYWRRRILELLHGLPFVDPTSLEHAGHLHRDRLPWQVLERGRPCLVGVPLNRVARDSGMPHMGVHEFDLNERFLQGGRLQLPVVDGDLPAHAELDLRFDVQTVTT